VNRREFIVGGLITTACPTATQAQQPPLPVVGFINGGRADAAQERLTGFRKGLSESGFIESQNITVEYHFLDGHYELLPALLSDMVQRRVAVIATPGSDPDAVAAKAATSSIPIVFGVAQDPVTLGLVASLAHPGGNATGVNFFNHEIETKRLGLMHQLLPDAHHFAVLLNPINARAAETTRKILTEASQSLGIDSSFFNASTPSEIDIAFTDFASDHCNALFIMGDGFFNGQRAQFAALTERDRMPASFAGHEAVEKGLLLSYGASTTDMFRQVAIYVGSILRGAKPSDLPVIQPTRFELALNLKTAKSLGITIPPSLLAIADEVIE
jgi:ABC-type uncharacterized transport system substrate-binding protein